jgi:hypothetical protein
VTGSSTDLDALHHELAAHPKREELAGWVREAAYAAADRRNARFPLNANDLPPNPEPAIEDATWNTSAGNVLLVLKDGAQSRTHTELVSGWLAIGVRADFPSTPEVEREAAARLVWLAAHSQCNAFSMIDRALDEGRGALWGAVAKLILDPSLGGEGFGRTEALVGAAALEDSTSEAASRALAELAPRLSDPVLKRMTKAEPPSAGPASTPASELSGQLSFAPRRAAVTFLLAITLVLPLIHLFRLIGRYVFAYKAPAKVNLSGRGLELEYRTELLGRVLRERSTLVPFQNLASVTREVRFSRLGMYAGLLALVIGSYVGMGLFVDAVRVPGGSATLLGMATLLIVLGLMVDFGLSSLSDSVRGTCRVVVVPRKGRPVCIGSLNPRDADAMLSSITARAGS